MELLYYALSYVRFIFISTYKLKRNEFVALATLLKSRQNPYLIGLNEINFVILIFLSEYIFKNLLRKFKN